jgi:hypothetical protein
VQEAPAGLQDLLICVEMLFVAFAHKFVFSSDEFAVDESALGVAGHDDTDSINSNQRFIPPVRLSVKANLRYTFAHEDLVNDFRDIMRNR